MKCLNQQRGCVNSAVLALSGRGSEPSEEDGAHSGHSYGWLFDLAAFPMEDFTLALQGVGVEESPTDSSSLLAAHLRPGEGNGR